MDTENSYIPRLLIVSTNALNKGGSNGKVLSEFLSTWPSDKLAQFYTYNEKPDCDYCQRYFRVTDKEVLKSFFTGKQAGNIVDTGTRKTSELANVSSNRRLRKNPLTLLLRDMVWNSRRWQGVNFWNWIEDFKPEVILLQAGASSYTHNIALSVCEKYSLPLVIFNTENYYIKDYNYLKGRGWGWLFPVYKRECDNAFRKIMKHSCLELYTNSNLDEQYFKAFGKRGRVIYQGSSISLMDEVKNVPPIFSYAGNLGINRHIALSEIGKALQTISSEYVLDVYGRAPSHEVEQFLKNAQGVRFHGLLPYTEVIEVMKNSDFMVHAESFDPFWLKDLDAAFSTKISDILKAGKCLILYAAPSFACTKYIVDNNCGCVITSPSELIPKLSELINSESLMTIYRKNAIATAARDMDGHRNSTLFLKYVQQAACFDK